MEWRFIQNIIAKILFVEVEKKMGEFNTKLTLLFRVQKRWRILTYNYLVIPRCKIRGGFNTKCTILFEL